MFLFDLGLVHKLILTIIVHKKVGNNRIKLWPFMQLLLLLLLKSLLSRVTTDVQLYKCQIPIYYR